MTEWKQLFEHRGLVEMFGRLMLGIFNRLNVELVELLISQWAVYMASVIEWNINNLPDYQEAEFAGVSATRRREICNTMTRSCAAMRRNEQPSLADMAMGMPQHIAELEFILQLNDNFLMDTGLGNDLVYMVLNNIMIEEFKKVFNDKG